MLSRMQDGIVIESTAYDQLVTEIERMKTNGITGYRVIWETEDRNHSATEYVVKDFGEHLGEPTLFIWGRGGNQDTGGKYEVIPKPNSEAWIQYHHPSNKNPSPEKLKRLAVFSPDFAYVDENEQLFWKKPFKKLEQLRNR